LKDGYDWAYREFYRWPSIVRGSLPHGSLKHQAKHFFYAAGWKKFEGLWDAVIRARQLPAMTPVLEAVLSKISGRRPLLDAPIPAELREPGLDDGQRRRPLVVVRHLADHQEALAVGGDIESCASLR